MLDMKIAKIKLLQFTYEIKDFQNKFHEPSVHVKKTRNVELKIIRHSTTGKYSVGNFFFSFTSFW